MEVEGRIHQSRNYDIDVIIDGKRYAGNLWYPTDEREWDYQPTIVASEGRDLDNVEQGMEYEAFEAICKIIDHPRDAQDALYMLRFALSGDTKLVLNNGGEYLESTFVENLSLAEATDSTPLIVLNTEHNECTYEYVAGVIQVIPE